MIEWEGHLSKKIYPLKCLCNELQYIADLISEEMVENTEDGEEVVEVPTEEENTILNLKEIWRIYMI